jgi:hypothetical protein
LPHSGIVAKKLLTQTQAETAKKRAESFLRNVLQDDDRADEVESQTLDEWAEDTGRTITDERKNPTMATTKTELQGTIDQINDLVASALDPINSREDVVEKLQQIDDLLNGETDESDLDDSDEDIDED